MSALYIFTFAVADVIQFTPEFEYQADAEALEFAAQALDHQLAVRHPEAVAATMQVDRAGGDGTNKLGFWRRTPDAGKVWCSR